MYNRRNWNKTQSGNRKTSTDMEEDFMLDHHATGISLSNRETSKK